MWSHDLTQAPRDGSMVLAVHKTGKVVQSYWVPVRHTLSGKVLEGNRWSGFNLGSDPIAWAPWPTYEPNAVVQPMSVNTGAVEFMSAVCGEGGC